MTTTRQNPSWLSSFDLRHDQDEFAAIEASVHQGATAIGANLWGLVFAIVIASVGLNVNSTAVIIGAMLISPLMGPIVGMGFGAGVNDIALIRRSARNLALMVGFSLIAATAYFALSPLKAPTAELLARTSPTLWDVLIAFFGGAAGIVALTRRGVSNAIPGVAIATALMPPICTAGYGIANGEPEFALGALYLFLINGVFIAFATLLLVRVMRLPVKAAVDDGQRVRQRAVIGVFVLALAVPSAWLAWKLVRAEQFSAAANAAIQRLAESRDTIVLAREVDGRRRLLELTVTGERPANFEVEALAELRRAGFPDAAVQLRYAGAEKLDIGSLQATLQQAVVGNTVEALEAATRHLAEVQARLDAMSARENVRAQLLAELASQFPDAERIDVTSGPSRQAGEAKESALLRARLWVDAQVSSEEQARWIAGWQQRFPDYAVEVEVLPAATATNPVGGE